MTLNIVINVQGVLIQENLVNTIRNRAQKAEKDAIDKQLSEARAEKVIQVREAQRQELAAQERRRESLDRLKQKPAASDPPKNEKKRYDIPFVVNWLFGLPRSSSGNSRYDPYDLSLDEALSSQTALYPVATTVNRFDNFVQISPVSDKASGEYLLSPGARGEYEKSSHLEYDLSGVFNNFSANFQKTSSESFTVFGIIDPNLPAVGDNVYDSGYRYWKIRGEMTYFAESPKIETCYNACFCLPLSAGPTVTDARTLIVKCNLINTRAYPIRGPVWYWDVEDSESQPKTSYYANGQNQPLPNSEYFTGYVATAPLSDLDTYLEALSSPDYDPLIDRINYGIGSSLLSEPDTVDNKQVLQPLDYVTLDIECYLSDNLSVNKIECPEKLRAVIEKTFEIQEINYDIPVLREINFGGTILTETVTSKQVYLVDNSFWVNKSFGFDVVKGCTLVSSLLLPYDYSSFSARNQGDKHGAIYGPDIYEKLLKYDKYIEGIDIPGSSYLNPAYPTINTTITSFDDLYSAELRNSSNNSRGIDLNVWYRNYRGGNYGFAYKAYVDARGIYTPSPGPVNVDEWQVQDPDNPTLFPSVHSVQGRDEPIIDPFELYSSFSYYEVSNIIISWTGGNDDYCITMARALGFPVEVTGLTSSEKQEENPPAE